MAQQRLGIILVVLMGWQFMAAEYLGGILMVLFLAVIFRLTLTPRLIQRAKEQAEEGRQGRMEGHAAMDMSVSGGSFWRKLWPAFIADQPKPCRLFEACRVCVKYSTPLDCFKNRRRTFPAVTLRAPKEGVGSFHLKPAHERDGGRVFPILPRAYQL